MNDNMLFHNGETLKHVNKVREHLAKVIFDLDHRSQVHDKSKFESPEKEIFAENNSALAVTEYGTPEYQALLTKLKPALDHHYANNRHHPEHWVNGVEDMTLMDLVEMLCDWKAGTERTKNGNIRKSIEHNAKRFSMSPQLEKIFHNTVRELFTE